MQGPRDRRGQSSQPPPSLPQHAGRRRALAPLSTPVVDLMSP